MASIAFPLIKSLPNLVEPWVTAEEKVRDQIKIARVLSNRIITTWAEYNKAVDESNEFYGHTSRLLRRIFQDESVSDAYSFYCAAEKELETLKIAVRNLKKSHKTDITFLECVLERIKVGAGVSGFGILNRDIFVVHGHDEAVKESVARFVEKLGLSVTILHEQPNAGRTIIEKFEDHSSVGFAIVLLTPDDVGAPKNTASEPKPRARQNVILELGYFMGKLGRGRVCALYKEGVEIPSDYQGVVYTPMDSGGAWKMQLAKEIKNVGIDIDLNKL